jgi:hypothetical protein
MKVSTTFIEKPKKSPSRISPEGANLPIITQKLKFFLKLPKLLLKQIQLTNQRKLNEFSV